MCPECQVLAGPLVVDLMNGILSLLKYGLDSMHGGFAPYTWRNVNGDDYEVGNYLLAEGFNQYTPSEGLDSIGVVDELATLLTSGRLSHEKRALLQSVYSSYSGAEAYINVQQVMATLM